MLSLLLLAACHSPCEPLPDPSALSGGPYPLAVQAVADACPEAFSPALRAMLADEAAGKPPASLPPELLPTWDAACPGLPPEEATDAAWPLTDARSHLTARCGLTRATLSLGNATLAVLARQELQTRKAAPEVVDAVVESLLGSPLHIGAEPRLPKVPTPLRRVPAGYSLVKGLAVAGNLTLSQANAQGVFPLPPGPGGWTVEDWTRIAPDTLPIFAVDANEPLEGLYRLAASLGAKAGKVGLLVAAGDGTQVNGPGVLELALPRNGEPDARDRMIRLAANASVEDLARSAVVLRDAGFNPVIPLDHNPCLKAPEGMTCVSGGPYAASDKRTLDISTFYLDEAEVTATEYQACVDADFCEALPGKDAALTNARWMDANRYCTWSGKRLPTEWEWEKAAHEAPGSQAFTGSAPEWTRSWKEGSIASCGKACGSPDPLGPCAGAEPCDHATQRVARAGLHVDVAKAADLAALPSPEPPRSDPTRRIAGAARGAIRCAVSGGPGGDPPPFATGPTLTRYPPRQLTATPPEPPLPSPPTEAHRAIAHGIATDPIEAKPVCNEEVMKTWNFQTVKGGGRSETDCRDPISYVTSNEKRLDAFTRYIRNVGGGYTGVGAAQNYDFIALARSDWAWLFDYDINVVRVHRVLKALILGSETPQVFVASFDDANVEASLDLIRKTWANDPEVGTYCRTYLGYRTKLRAEYTADLKPAKLNPDFGWLAHPEQYTWVRTLYQQDRIVPLEGDMLSTKTMRGIADAARQLGVTLEIFYTSNAPTSWGGQITPAWRANVAALPFDDRSLTLVTWNHGSYGGTDYWHYHIQRGLQYQARLQHPGYTYMWQLAWDRIPSDDADLTISGLAGD